MQLWAQWQGHSQRKGRTNFCFLNSFYILQEVVLGCECKEPHWNELHHLAACLILRILLKAVLKWDWLSIADTQHFIRPALYSSQSTSSGDCRAKAAWSFHHNLLQQLKQLNQDEEIGRAAMSSVQMALGLWNKILELEEIYICAMISQPPPCICPYITLFRLCKQDIKFQVFGDNVFSLKPVIFCNWHLKPLNHPQSLLKKRTVF